MGERGDELHEEAARGHRPPDRAPPRTEHQDDVQEHAHRPTIPRALDLALQLLVRHFCSSCRRRTGCADASWCPDSLELLRTFYAEGLVDNRTFLTWLVQQTGTCNLAQLALVARLADQYLDGMLINRALTHHFVDACLNRLEEARYFHPRSQRRVMLTNWP